MPNLALNRPRRRLCLPLVLALTGAFFSARPAAAGIVVAVENVTNIGVGSTNNALEITLTNTGPSAVNIGAFSFGLTVSGTDIVFNQADITAASPYVFAGHSLFGPVISTSGPGQALLASDAFDVVNSGASLSSGATVGLGRVLFDVSGSASPGAVFAVTLDRTQTSLADFVAGDVHIDTFSDGSITLASSAPAPSSLTLASIGLAPCLLVYVVRRRFRGRAGPSALSSA